MKKFHIQSFIKLVSSYVCNPVSVFRLFFFQHNFALSGKNYNISKYPAALYRHSNKCQGRQQFFLKSIVFFFFNGFFNFSRILLPHVHLSELKCSFAQFSYNNIAPSLLSKMIKFTIFQKILPPGNFSGIILPRVQISRIILYLIMVV